MSSNVEETNGQKQPLEDQEVLDEKPVEQK